MSAYTLGDAMRDGYACACVLSDGSVAAVQAMSYGKGRLCLGLEEIGHEDAYCYETLAEAESAMINFDPQTMDEPSGWIRHPRTGRRRPDKTPESEYVMR